MRRYSASRSWSLTRKSMTSFLSRRYTLVNSVVDIDTESIRIFIYRIWFMRIFVDDSWRRRRRKNVTQFKETQAEREGFNFNSNFHKWMSIKTKLVSIYRTEKRHERISERLSNHKSVWSWLPWSHPSLEQLVEVLNCRHRLFHCSSSLLAVCEGCASNCTGCCYLCCHEVDHEVVITVDDVRRVLMLWTFHSWW